jgi:hypothetical protein
MACSEGLRRVLRALMRLWSDGQRSFMPRYDRVVIFAIINAAA